MRLLVIFSGYNQRAVVSFLRVVALYDVPFVIVSSGPQDPIQYSSYKDKVCYDRMDQSLSIAFFEPLLDFLRDSYPGYTYIFLPSSEALNRFLIDNVEYFSRKNVFIPLVQKSTYCLISDKYVFKSFCKDSSIKIPDEFPDLCKLPAVAKPKRGHASQYRTLYPRLIFNDDERTDFLKSVLKDDFFFERYIEGESYYLLYYFSKSGKVISYSQKNLVQQPGGKSIVAAESASIHREEVGDRFVALFKRLKFWGPVMVEVRFDGSDYYFIEANPRPWGPSQLFVDAGIKLFEHYLMDMGFDLGADMDSNSDGKESTYFWLGGLVNSMRDERGPTYHKGISEEAFKKNIGSFIRNEIYMREDTFQIYLKELL